MIKGFLGQVFGKRGVFLSRKPDSDRPVNSIALRCRPSAPSRFPPFFNNKYPNDAQCHNSADLSWNITEIKKPGPGRLIDHGPGNPLLSPRCNFKNTVWVSARRGKPVKSPLLGRCFLPCGRRIIGKLHFVCLHGVEKLPSFLASAYVFFHCSAFLLAAKALYIVGQQLSQFPATCLHSFTSLIYIFIMTLSALSFDEEAYGGFVSRDNSAIAHLRIPAA